MPDGTLLQMSLYEADKATEKAEVRTLRCCLDGGPEACPLGQKGQCLGTNLFGGSRCMYGRSGSSFSASKRSKSYAGFVKDAKAKIAALKATGFRSPKEVRLQLLRIGEWVCLPNGQITSCETVPFRAHGGVFRTGSPWLKTEDLTIENLLKLCNFRPHAMMGGEITSYQREEVPNLLLQLKFREPELFAALMAAAPELEAKVPDPSRFVGKELHVTKFPPGTVTLKFGKTGEERLLQAEWDGEKLTAELDGTARTWLMNYGETVTVTFTPDSNHANVVVTEEMAPELYEAGAFD